MQQHKNQVEWTLIGAEHNNGGYTLGFSTGQVEELKQINQKFPFN